MKKSPENFPRRKPSVLTEMACLDVFIIQNKAKIEIFVGTVIATWFDLIRQNSVMEITQFLRSILSEVVMKWNGS